MSTVLLLYILNIASGFFPVLAGITYYRNLEQNYRYLLYLLLVSLTAEAAHAVLGVMQVNTIFVIHLYTLAECILLYFFFASTIQSLKGKMILRWIAAFLIAIAIIDSLFISGVNKLNSLSFIVEGIVAIGYCLFLFSEIAMVKNESPISGGVFWINGALMFYFFSNLLYFGVNFWLLPNNSEALKIQAWIHMVLHLISNLVITFGIWNTQRPFTWARQ